MKALYKSWLALNGVIAFVATVGLTPAAEAAVAAPLDKPAVTIPGVKGPAKANAKDSKDSKDAKDTAGARRYNQQGYPVDRQGHLVFDN